MKLTEPIETSIDHEARAAYVTFHAFAPGENVRCLRLEHDVVVEFNAADEVLGLELLDFEPETIARADAFCQRNDLHFPLQVFEALEPRLSA